MKSKNGFTLIEVLITIVVIGLLLIISIPIINNINKQATVKANKIFYNNVKSSALTYVSEFSDDVIWNVNTEEDAVSDNEFTCVSVKALKEKGFFTEDSLIPPGEEASIINNLIKIERNKNNKVINNENIDIDNTICQVIDKTVPTINVILKDESGNNIDINNINWTNGSILQIISANDENGVDYIKVNYGNGEEIIHNGYFLELTRSDDINSLVNVSAVDKYGNESSKVSYNLKIDKIAPTCEISVDGIKSSVDESWYINSPTLDLFYRDVGDIKSEVSLYNLTENSSVDYASLKDTISNIPNTSGKKYYGYVRDYAGNENSCYKEVKVDTTVPTKPVISGGSDDFSVNDIVIKLTQESVAFSGISHYEYCLSDTNSNTECSFVSLDDGITDITFSDEKKDVYIFYRAVSNAGVTGLISDYQRIRIDKITPTINLNNVSSSFTYGTSKVLPSSVTYGISGGNTVCKYGSITITNTSQIPVGNYTITCTATGNNGKTATAQKSVTVVSPCECAYDFQCGSNYSCDGCSCYYDPECYTDSDCATNYSCSFSGSCYYDPPATTTCGIYRDNCSSGSDCCSGYVCSRTHSYCVPSSSGGGSSSSCTCSTAFDCGGISDAVCSGGYCCTKIWQDNAAGSGLNSKLSCCA